MLSISPEILNYIISKFQRSEIFLFFVAFLEMFRRFMWNCLKMEIEHIKNVNNFKAVENLNLPIKNFKFNINEMLIAYKDLDHEFSDDDS